MTIEAILQEQTELLTAQNKMLADLLQRIGSGQPVTAASEIKAAPKAQEKVDPKAQGEEKAPAKAPAAKVEEPKAEAPVEQAVTYDDVKTAVTALVVAKGRQVGIDVLNGLGVASATELRPEQWPLAIDACKAAML